jgi:hypothetical protein
MRVTECARWLALVPACLVQLSASSAGTRAFRTRLGNGNVRARYCVDGSVTVAAVVIQLLVQAESNSPTESDTASDLIQATLNRFHRCPAGSGK